MVIVQAWNTQKAMGAITRAGMRPGNLMEDAMKRKELWTLGLINLHLFDDADNDSTDADDDKQTDKDDKDNDKGSKKYSDEDLDRIISEKFAKWQKSHQKDIDEAQKLANMTAEEKNKAENEKLRQQVQDLLAKNERAEMTRSARSRLASKNVNVPDELIGVLVGKDAEATAANVDAFVTMFTTAVSDAVKDALKGTTPKKGTNSSITKEDIMKIKNRVERQKS